MPRTKSDVEGHEAVVEGYHIYMKIQQDAAYTVEVKKHAGKNHLVVPVVMMVEGVHHGSHGPLLHQINDLGRFPESWNGIPIVIQHPEIDGVNVSANSPDIIEKRKVGRIYNTYIKDTKKLAAQAWLDEEKLQALSKEVLDQIKAGKPLEVSLGMFTEEELVTGEYEGEHYEAIARNHRPDHLALLPGSVGACSIADGCGIRANSDGSTVEFTIKGEDLVGLVRTRFSTNLKMEDKKMAEKAECTPCVKKKVDELIANSQGKYTDTDREMLETLSEVLLDKITQPVTVEKEVVVEKEKVVEVNILSDEDKAALADYKRILKEKHDALIKRIQDNSEKGTWTDEELNNMKDIVLEKVANMVKKAPMTDYSLNGNGNIQANGSEEEPLAPTGITFKK